MEIKAKRNGIFGYIDWNTISLGLLETFKDSNKTSISLEFLKSIGEWVETGNTLVTVYEENNNENKEEKIKSSFVDKNSTLSNKIEKEIDNKKHLNYKHKQNIINDFRNQILSSIDINKDRDISKDPMLGIELLRNLAIKSAKKMILT